MKEIYKKQLRNGHNDHDEEMLKHIMEAYQEIDGKLLWDEYETALHKNDVVNIPIALDCRCKNLIQSCLDSPV